MEKNYNIELDFILEQLIIEYQNSYQGVNFYTDDKIYTTKEKMNDLVKEKFPLTLSNVPMFNGWDADVIIPELKIAVLWNGNWHHKKITKKHSVLQVQNRDRIKIKEIERQLVNKNKNVASMLSITLTNF